MAGLESECGIPVLKPGPEHRFELDEKALSSLLLREDIRDRAVVVLSVAGAFRKGKSFLLSFLLRYLHYKYNNQGWFRAPDAWLGARDEPLTGFHWRGGANRDTAGILLWSQPFKATLPTGEKVAILLMDTQGIFDDETTVRENMTVFALSTLVSSVQVYNLSQNINESDLQHLEFFMEYGRLVQQSGNNTGKPFQWLQFLVRDWQVPYEMSYGAEGGRKLLDRRLEIREGQAEELRNVRTHIAECFDRIECFLMPYPGSKVATKPEFDGKVKDMDEDFVTSLKQLVPMLLAPENLVVKRINGQNVKAKELLHYFKEYIETFNGNELPEVTTLLEATLKASYLTAISEALEVYDQNMQVVCEGNTYVPFLWLEEVHHSAKEAALKHFDGKRTLGSNERSNPFRTQLLKEIRKRFKRIWDNNTSIRGFLGYVKDVAVVGSTVVVKGAVATKNAVLAGSTVVVKGAVATKNAILAGSTVVVKGTAAAMNAVVSGARWLRSLW